MDSAAPTWLLSFQPTFNLVLRTLLSSTAWHLRFGLRRHAEETLRSPWGNSAHRVGPKVRRPADIDGPNPREHPVYRCNEYRLMAVASHLRSVRHSMAHRRSHLLPARRSLHCFSGDGGTTRQATDGKSNAPWTLHEPLLPTWLMSRSRPSWPPLRWERR